MDLVVLLFEQIAAVEDAVKARLEFVLQLQRQPLLLLALLSENLLEAEQVGVQIVGPLVERLGVGRV